MRAVVIWFARAKSLIVIKTMLLLKATSHKTSFVTLKRTIGVSLDLVDPLAGDGTNARREGNQIPSARALKIRQLFSHRKLPFRLSHGSPIGGGLSKNRETVPIRRVAIRRRARPDTKVVNRGRREQRLTRGGRRVRHVRRSILSTRAASIVERKR